VLTLIRCITVSPVLLICLALSANTVGLARLATITVTTALCASITVSGACPVGSAAEEVENNMLQPLSNLASREAGPARVKRARDGHLAVLVALDVAPVVQVFEEHEAADDLVSFLVLKCFNCHSQRFLIGVAREVMRERDTMRRGLVGLASVVARGDDGGLVA